MKCFKHILTLFILSPLAVCAQQTATDSLYLYQQDRRQVDFVSQNGTQLVSSGINKLSQAGLAYTTINGHFRTSQQAESTKSGAFGTSGIATLGRFKIYGDFSFSRMWQDSLSWSLKGIADDADPYYFGAIKAGAWERINYTLNALGTYRLLGDKLYLASGLNYFYNTAARSVDPRASIQTFRFRLTPELIYRSNRHTIGLSALWGYEHEDNLISYRNINYSSGQGYPDRILYQVFGYGSFAPAGIRNLRRQGTYNGLGLNYAYVDSIKYLRVGVQYQEHDVDELFPLTSSSRYGRYGSFYLQHYNMALLAGINGAQYKHQLVVNLAYDPGKDQNATLKASSYKYRSTTASVGYSLQEKGTARNQLEFGAQVLYTDHSQRDLSVSHTFNYTCLQPGVQVALYHRYYNAARLKLALSPALRVPLSSYLVVPSGEENVVFNNNVTYPDYAYYTSTAGVLNAAAEYVTPRLFHGVYSSFSANVMYDRPFTTGTVYPAAAFVPSGSCLQAILRFNIYF